MKYFILLLVGFVSSAKAQTYFEYVGEMFFQGSRPEINEIMETSWTGRCFKRNNPNLPSNIGLYVRERETSEDVGPIPLTQYELANYTFHNRPANFLDDKDHDYLASFIEPLYELLEMRRYDLRFFNRQSGRRVWGYIRKNGDYLFHLFYDEYGREGNARCYYWKV